jgi:hypothetical protein
MLLQRKQLVIPKTNRPEKGGSFSLAGKKEGVWGRNFCLPDLSLFRPSLRRPPAFGRRRRELPRKLYLLAILLLKVSSNFLVQGAPNRKLRFFCTNYPRILQATSHLLPREQEVRLRKAQSTTSVVQPIFCILPKAKLLNFQEESDNFFALMRVCPKAITI